MFNIILYQPEIPPNTGNVIRLCANTGCMLHLVRPMGFNLEEKSLQRAGMDYADVAQVREHDNLKACLEALDPARLFAIETSGTRPYTQVQFLPGDALLFGNESSGLPQTVLRELADSQVLSIPMRPANRSLNLSNSVAVVVYEAWRQQGFALTP